MPMRLSAASTYLNELVALRRAKATNAKAQSRVLLAGLSQVFFQGAV
jgi:hypothetical protein